MTLASDLAAFRAAFLNKAPPDIRAVMINADLTLAASGIAERALRAGDAAPDFTLPGVDGQPVRLATLLAAGPVVLSFYRGGWCPYCNLELRALQAALPEFRRMGASLVAVSSQTPDASLSTAEQNALAYPVLSDANSDVAKAYRIAFDLAGELRPIYSRFGHALPDRNGDESWVLPIPATYVIASDGTIALAFVDVDYRNRLEPDEIIAALASISTRTRA